MITENDDSVDAMNELMRKISIKETQLKIAQESNLIQTAEALENQLSQLQQENEYQSGAFRDRRD
ncbi:hypothetical protein KBT16_20070 [Nostoc sp. CCCryo 231-06]|nr:hypothetical protein [Nostoc sp. CCCryo 231-06]